MQSTIYRTFREHWTDSGDVVVLDGKPKTILRIAEGLAIPPSRVVRVNSQRALLALWGDVSSRYLGHRANKNYANRDSVGTNPFHYLPAERGDKMRHHSEPKS
jgi:hypothetical protein